mgnify:CR=1 FL=1
MRFLDFAIPAAIGFFSGLLPPVIIEKWKTNKEEKKQLTLLEKDMQDLVEHYKNVSSSISIMEEKIRALELNLSHNTGVLKAKIPEAPLEGATLK